MAAAIASNVFGVLASKWWLACFGLVAACGSDSEGVFDAAVPPPSPCPDCQLISLSPATAGKGARIVLEGTFGEAATVEFAGGIKTNAMVLGPHRISALVPLNTDGGNLVVHVGSTTLGPIDFRRASFDIALGPFETDLVQVGARTRTQLVTARRGAASVLAGGGLFVIGGADRNVDLASVERALVNADGSLAPFASSGALVQARHGHTATVIGSHVVVAGGAGVAAAASVEVADVGGDGKLGAFRTAAVALTGERWQHTAVVIGNYLYLIGGTDGQTVLTSVERAPIALDGTLGAFAAVPESVLAVGRAGHTSAVVGGYVYAVGGTGNAGGLASVERAPINPDGTLGAFALVTSALAAPRSGHTMTAFDDVVYVHGGAGPGELDSVERAVINPDGSFGPFAVQPDLHLGAPRGQQTSAVVGNYVYILGGGQGSEPTASVERASFIGGSTPAPFSAGRISGYHQRGSAIVAIGRFMYALGGDDLDTGANHVAKVARTEVPANDDIAGFQTVLDNHLVHGRTGHTAAVIGDYVYVLGGSDGGPDPLPSERALIRADGSLGAFADVTPAIARSGHTAAVHGDSLYLFGGGAADVVATVDRVPIAADGSLGAPVRLTSAPPASTGAALGSTTLVRDDRFYVIGGLGADGLPARAQYAAPFLADGTLGAFVEVTATGQGRARHQGVVIGSQLVMFGGVIDNANHDATAVPGNALRLPLNADGTLGTQATFPFVAPEGGSATLIGNYVFIFGSLITRAQLLSP